MFFEKSLPFNYVKNFIKEGELIGNNICLNSMRRIGNPLRGKY